MSRVTGLNEDHIQPSSVDKMIGSPDVLARMQQNYCSNLVPPDAKNSFRDPTQTYLESPWTLWLVNKSGAQNKTWLECIHPVATFSTIQQFWGMYNTLKPPSELPSHWEYALFRGGIGRRIIVPDWDDTENIGGGCMQLTGFSLDAKTIDHLWRDVCLKAIEEAWIHTSAYINGAIVSTKAGTTRFHVWICPCKEHIWESVRDRIESVFGQDCRTPVKWTPHKERKSPINVKERLHRKVEPTLVNVSNFPRSFRSHSAGYRAEVDAGVRTVQAKRTTDSKETETFGEKSIQLPFVESSQGVSGGRTANQQHVGRPRRGRSCHGLEASVEYPVLNVLQPDHSRFQGSGDLSTAVSGRKVRFPALQQKAHRIARAMPFNAGKSKDMVDVSTQFNAKVTNMGAGGDAGEKTSPAESQNTK